jgi:hypothetical protein
MFLRNISLPASGLKSKLAVSFLLVFRLAYFFILKMKAMHSSETSSFSKLHCVRTQKTIHALHV